MCSVGYFPVAFFTDSFTEYESADCAMFLEVPNVTVGPINEAVDW